MSFLEVGSRDRHEGRTAWSAQWGRGSPHFHTPFSSSKEKSSDMKKRNTIRDRPVFLCVFAQRELFIVHFLVALLLTSLKCLFRFVGHSPDGLRFKNASERLALQAEK